MLNFIRWQKNNYQIVFEGVSFYFVRKMPIAFRCQFYKTDGSYQNQIFVKDQKFGAETQNFIDLLNQLGRKMIALKPEEFRIRLSSVYKNALFDGVRRVATDRMHITTPLKEIEIKKPMKNGECKNVTDQKDYDR